MPDETDLVPLLRGDLDTVSFVRDYVELRVDYNIVRCMTGPIVRVADGEVRFPDPGSRDALCGLIGSDVISAQVNDDAIELVMSSGPTLVLPLDLASRALSDGRVIPEAVHLVPADPRGELDVGRMIIW